MLKEKDQIQQLIEDSRHVLVVFDNSENIDAIASSLALSYFLEKKNKAVDIACSDFIAPKNVGFLTGIKNIKTELTHLQKLIVKVDISNAKIENLSYDIKDNWLSIYLTPKNGLLTKNELRTAQSSYKYDLIIALGTPSLESLGKIFLNNTDLFYRTNIINLDCDSSNERYGQTNYVDLNATSTSEMIFQIAKQLWEPSLSENVATTLLTGMIGATHSFKTNNVTPLTLQLASELINHGANRERIIQNLYRTRSLSALKLWGCVLSKLKIDTSRHFAWSSISKEEFSHAGANQDDLKDIISELISNSPEVDMTLLLYESENYNGEKIISGILHSKKGHDTLNILKRYNPTGTPHEARFNIPNVSLNEIEQTLIEEIKKSLS